MNELLNVDRLKDIISEEKYQNKIKLFKKPMSCNCHSHDRFRVKSNGDISLCMGTDDIPEAQLGNYKQNSFLDIWEKRLNNICFKQRKFEAMPCYNCKYNVICNAGCQIKAYSEHQDINKPQQNCIFLLQNNSRYKNNSRLKQTVGLRVLNRQFENFLY